MSAPGGGKTVQALGWILLVVGVISVLVSLLILGFAALASFGALADAGPAENRRMAVQLLSWGLLPLIGGLVLSGFGIMAFVRNRKRAGSGQDGLATGSTPLRE
jgi:sorbitol-specific phosphotransferase system component IIC